MKTCSKCKYVKSLEEYNNRRASKDGKRSECRICQKESRDKYRQNNPNQNKEYYQANKEHISRVKKEHYNNNKEIYSAIGREYYQKNKDHLLEMNSVYRKTIPDKMRGYRRKYKVNNKDKVRLSEMKRRDYKNNLPNTMTEEQVREVIGKFNNSCCLCESEYEHLDHFIPISSGKGGTYRGNIVPMCASCNISKNNKNPYEWIKSRNEEQRERFSSLVKYLSDISGIMDTEIYKAHVESCFE